MEKEDFKLLFDTYFDAIKNYLFYRVGDVDIATDITQDVFMRIWEKQMKLDMNNAKYLLYKIARDMLVSKYRRMEVENKYVNRMQFEMTEITTDNSYDFKQLQKKYDAALMRLPEKQRTVFLMSRSEELKYAEIAERLDISIKTVEKRMSNALFYLRKVLA
ncbi:MAG: RNA polymerase sigma-70 factor [Bacteroidetes bacterium]|nr:RNA polymerase sigma-70 factor [Bacteroidota bacterium]MBU1373051.1 RNA polymerase sigma-70 factor [Bacteroidota bacterium]MBU1484232.1 RNA polymerase sigma-70 factor [Bacteroidota bacterium]MBU1759355.1 RNA polymerase sigma-70 factor [Bacteroidota bacterium]MBU2046303.1 RNA polymerase sigma-70 factor [Bacteroidota bacterium]